VGDRRSSASSGQPRDDVDDVDDLVDDEAADRLAEAEAELDEARQRLASVPAAQVVANHAMGLFELAAIHLSVNPANRADAALAIDALRALLEGVGDRLGEVAPTLRDALSQIQLAFVQVTSSGN
jgi:hypothetical protein